MSMLRPADRGVSGYQGGAGCRGAGHTLIKARETMSTTAMMIVGVVTALVPVPTLVRQPMLSTLVRQPRCVPLRCSLAVPDPRSLTQKVKRSSDVGDLLKLHEKYGDVFNHIHVSATWITLSRHSFKRGAGPRSNRGYIRYKQPYSRDEGPLLLNLIPLLCMAIRPEVSRRCPIEHAEGVAFRVRVITRAAHRKVLIAFVQ